MGRGRDYRLFAERTFIAARPRIQRHQREGTERVQIRAISKIILGLGSHPFPKRKWIFPVYTRHQSALRIERILANAGRGRSEERSVGKEWWYRWWAV